MPPTYSNPQQAQDALTKAFTPAGGSLTPEQQAAIKNAASLVPTASTVPPPTTVSSQSAQDNLDNIKSNVADITSGMANQATKKAQINATQNGATAVNAGDKYNTQLNSDQDVLNSLLGIQKTTGGGTPNAQYYYTPTVDQNGNTTYSYYDTNGNKLTQNPYGEQYNNNPTQAPQYATGELAQFNPASAPWNTNQAGGINAGGTAAGVIATTNQYLNNLSVNQNAALAQLQNQTDAQYANYKSQLDSIVNGTFQLTPAQQSLYESVNQNFELLRQEQNLQNIAYVQGMEVAEARTGELQGGIQTAQGNINAAVATGVRKIAELDAQASQALAQLQTGFRTDNLNAINAAWDSWQKYASAKEATLKDMYTTSQQSIQDMRNQTYTMIQDTIKNTMASEQLTWTQKQNTIQNMLAQSQLDETKRHNLAVEAENNYKTSLQYAANQFLLKLSGGGGNDNSGNGGNTLQPVTTLPDGTPDPVAQQKFISQFPPLMQQLIKGLADYTIDPKSSSSYSSGTGLNQAQAVAFAQMYDPTYNQAEYAARSKFLTAWTAGGQNAVTVAANTALQHIGELNGVIDQIANSNNKGILSQTYNNLSQFLEKNSGDPNVAKFQTIVTSLSGELAKIYKNGINSSASPTEVEESNQGALLNLSWGKEGLKGMLGQIVNLMTDRLTSAQQNYQSVMGKDPSALLYSSAQDSLNQLANDGVTFNQDNVNALTNNVYSNMSAQDLLSSMGTSTSATSTGMNANPNLFNLLWMNSMNAGNLQLNQ
ncbi:hypothetical protein M1506_00235 [Patescibacteria group bacterium]|nr:hypothetical protein [Patescibacteria group bacterium]